ncbi:MAG: aldehyde dehydrogenase family protein [Bryobacteraceae bacterium]|nr:aldehyde dehydrogenase family protein [Bryobacteraceae bacterium]
MQEFALWIDGREAKGERVRSLRIPFDQSEFARVHEAGAAQVEAALESARRAARVMRSLTAAERGAILLRAHGMLVARREEFARVISQESGKPLREGRIEAARGADTLLFSANEALRLSGEVVPMEAAASGAGRMAMTLREPLGVIAAITPFNFPLNLSLHKIGPALAAGNAVVHKPASATPLSGLMVARLLSEAGLPGGALNSIPGPGAVVGDALTRDERVAMVTFTGSAEVGVALRARSGMKRVTLELGNNSALIVHGDADLDDCLPRAVSGAYAHSGQVCISVQRILVHQRVFQEFAERFAAGAAGLRIGHPLEEETQVSSLITPDEARRVRDWIREAAAAGARVSGGAASGPATVTPALLLEAPEEAAVWSKEAFGPLACLRPYDTLDEAIELMNRSAYGLQAGIFTRDLAAAFRAAKEAEVGGFLINDVPQFRVDQMPYGGVKMSGTGREGPRYAIEEMTETKLVSWRWS